jgi:ABC-2 type transport system ATP-binding protein
MQNPPLLRPVTAAAPSDGIGLHAEGLGKRYDDLWALRGLDLDVPTGTVLGLLGHNGAGKTTAIKIFTTLSLPTEGIARVAGYDVVTDSLEVRRRIGVAAQQATVDGLLTARANLVMVGRLHDLPKDVARRRAGELLDQLDLSDAADRLVKTYSGGMRRRLDLAASIVATPDVLFLDEPTTGLDPLSRGELWEVLRRLAREGTTIVLTTQYLEEADRLADDIVLLDHGQVVAHGTPDELKERVGENLVDITVSEPSDLEPVAQAAAGLAAGPASYDLDLLTCTVPLREGATLVQLVRALDAAGLDPVDLSRRTATLDDVFLSLTARPQPAVTADPASTEASA